jgi:2-dehydropantoate 2-reductase
VKLACILKGLLMRVAVVGCGAIGGWLAARLALAGAQVSVLARGATLAALKERGLRLTEGGQSWRLPVQVSQEPAQLGPHELVVLAVKGHQLADAAPLAAALLAPGGKVLSAMNGVPWWFFADRAVQAVDPGGAVRALLPPERVLGSVVHASCQSSTPGEILHVMGQGWLVGDAQEPGSPLEGDVVALLTGAGFEARSDPDIRASLWYKLWGNATTNPISALTGATTDKILDDPLTCSLMDAAMHELSSVGTRLGYRSVHTPADRHAITRKLGAFKTSMLQDREAGKPLELEALLGAPREIAQALSVATPMLDALHGLARLMVQSCATPPPSLGRV